MKGLGSHLSKSCPGAGGAVRSGVAVLSSAGRPSLSALVIVALLTAMPFLLPGEMGNFVIFDDPLYVVENPMVRDGISVAGLRWAFSTFHASNWHPLTWLSHQVDAQLFGIDARGHHLMSVALHALNASLLYAALVRLTGTPRASGLVAALFGIHPLHVESVAWIAERKDVLSALFFMFILLSYESYVRRGGVVRYAKVLTLHALGLMAKPMLITVPFVLLLLDFWPLGRVSRSQSPAGRGSRSGFWFALILEKVPLLVLSLVSGVLTVLAQRSGGAISDLGEISATVRLSNAVISYVAYLAKTLWPSSLAVYYPHPLAMHPWWQVAGGLLLLTGVSVAVLGRVRSRPSLAVGWLWFVGMLVPVIGLIQVGAQGRADRYTYLPLVGLFIGVAWGAAGAPQLRRFATFAAMAIVPACIIRSADQVRRWHDDESLLKHALAVTTDNWLVHYNLAHAQESKGRYMEAIANYREAVRISPKFYQGHYNLALVLAGRGRMGEAVAELRASLRIRPDSVEAHNNMGNALAELGRREEAATHYREAIRLRPTHAAAHHNLATVLVEIGRSDEAAFHLMEARRLREPDGAAGNSSGSGRGKGR